MLIFMVTPEPNPCVTLAVRLGAFSVVLKSGSVTDDNEGWILVFESEKSANSHNLLKVVNILVIVSAATFDLVLIKLLNSLSVLRCASG